MPVYEYECNKCGEKFEARRNLSDKDEDVRCPKCHADQPKRVLSSFITGAPSADSCAPSGGG